MVIVPLVADACNRRLCCTDYSVFHVNFLFRRQILVALMLQNLK